MSEDALGQYADEVRREPGVTVDGYPESQEEHAGISRVKFWVSVIGVGMLCFILGGLVSSVFMSSQAKPHEGWRELTSQQYNALVDVASPKTRGYNDSGIGSLYANGYQPVAVADIGGAHYVQMTKCVHNATCPRSATEYHGDNPVVYLGLAREFKDAEQPRFDPSKLIIDLRRGDGGTQRCALHDAQFGEQGAVTFKLPETVAKVKDAYTNHDTQDPTGESPDGGLSYWTCKKKG